MKEEWKDIEGFENQYQISTLGNVKSLPRRTSYLQGGKYPTSMIVKGRLLKNHTDRNNYRIISLSKNGGTYTFLVHRLVAKAFIQNPDGKPHINHIDSNPANNVVENLEWCTPLENSQHCIKYGRGISSKYGEDNPFHKLTTNNVLEIRRLLGEGLKLRTLAKMFNCSDTNICDIKYRRSWKHI